MLHQRFNTGDEGEEIDPIKSMAKKILWMETYSQYICIILNIYRKLSEYEQNLFNKMENLIKNREIFLKEDEVRNPHHTIELKSPFYYVSEALLRLSVDNDLVGKLEAEGQKFYDFINLLKTISKDGLYLTEDLKIYSKEIFTIQQLLEIEKRLNIANKSTPENLLKALNYLLEQIKYSNNAEKLDDLSINIKSLYDFLKENLGDTNNFTELILDIFVAEIKKQSSDSYRQTLVEIVLSNPKLVAQSYPFISIIIKGVVKSSIFDLENNLQNIQDSQSGCFELINNSKNEIIHDILLSTFENIFNKYFKSIPNLKDDEEREMLPKH
jgi:hypothetical protein